MFIKFHLPLMAFIGEVVMDPHPANSMQASIVQSDNRNRQ